MRVDRDEDPTVVEGYVRTVDWSVLPREAGGLTTGKDAGMSKTPTLNQAREAVHPEGWEVRNAYPWHHLPCRDCRWRR